MEYRHVGKSGLKISELTYGNWITHGSQVEEEAARSCVAAALDEGITSFDTADAGMARRIDDVLGDDVECDPARTASPATRP